jgi:hypothetical protein
MGLDRPQLRCRLSCFREVSRHPDRDVASDGRADARSVGFAQIPRDHIPDGDVRARHTGRRELCSEVPGRGVGVLEGDDTRLDRTRPGCLEHEEETRGRVAVAGIEAGNLVGQALFCADLSDERLEVGGSHAASRSPSAALEVGGWPRVRKGGGVERPVHQAVRSKRSACFTRHALRFSFS